MRKILTLIAMTPLAACAGAYGGAPETDAPPPPAASAGICNAEPAQYHIGHQATEAMGAAILQESGARILRWGPPHMAWTMDYRQDRVSVRYDEAMKITEITCG